MLELNNIYLGDNISLIKELDNNSIDLTVTSPPYDNLRKYDSQSERECFTFDKFQTLAKELYRVTKEGGVVVWVVGDATIEGSETLTSFKQALYFKEVGFNMHDTMIYEKDGCGACGSNKCYIQNFEYMFVLSRGVPKSTNLIYDRQNKIYGGTKLGSTNRDINTVDNGRKIRNYNPQEYGRRYNIWKYNQSVVNDFQKQHPAPFPNQLVIDHIKSWSNENDVILDPFSGSGTTCVCAKQLNRKYIGFELSEKYYNLSKQCLISTDGVEVLKNDDGEQYMIKKESIW